jgi:sortase A
MDIKLPIYLGASEENMKKGAVHLTETSLPIGGKNTNCVIAAHRGFSGAPMFREIEKLKKGDKIYITNFWYKMTYQVVDIEIINPDDVEKVLIQKGRDLVTLSTCHPYRYNYQRYIVYCERSDK